ncbi:7469_t:CDS:1, partial [Cetraspora pellucida]
LKDNYPTIEVTRRIGNCNYNYQYDVLKLGNYPTKNIKQTQREKYRIPNNYKVQVLIYNQAITCETNYQHDGKVEYKVTWEKEKQKYEITSKSSP